MAEYRKGDKVKWDWGTGTAEGKVEKVYERKVTRKISGSDITRNGSEDDPAVFVIQSDGGKALKLTSEIKKG